jgi:UDP-glucose 4-epimerase
MSEVVAITGGSGFIGSHVVDQLIDAGYEVRVIDPVKPHRDDVDWRPVDILDVERLTPNLIGTTAIFHLAAASDVNLVRNDPYDSVRRNILGTTGVLEAARLADAGRVVLASTVWVYAATEGQIVDETTPFSPETDRHLYVTTKVACEMLCRDYQTLYQRPYTVLRYGIPYGPRMRDSVVSAVFFRKAMAGEPLTIDGDGSQERFFVYVEDLARAHVLALQPVAENRTYNLDGDKPVTIRMLAEQVKELVGDVTVTYGPTRPGDLASRLVRTDRAREELGWVPRVPFEEGLRRTYEWILGRQAKVAQGQA